MKKKLLILSVFTLLFAVDYETEIQPIFNDNCGNCHLGNSSGGLNLSSYANLMSNNVIVPGNHQESELYDRITRPESAQGDMPPSGSLSQEQIDLIALWIDEGALPDEEPTAVVGCTDSNALTCEDQLNSPICEDFDDVADCLDNVDCLWDSFGLSCSGGFSVYFPSCDTCSDDDPCDNYFNPEATEDNGMCMYLDVPSYDEVSINSLNPGFQIDWSAFTPPVAIQQYVLQRCLDPDGDTDGDGYLEYENCVMIIPPMSMYLGTDYFDDYSDEVSTIKYTLYVDYPNNQYWGSAHGYYYYEENSLLMGDLNFDGIINIIDIVTMVNGILGPGFTEEQLTVADMNGDGIVNVIDIVFLVNLILG